MHPCNCVQHAHVVHTGLLYFACRGNGKIPAQDVYTETNDDAAAMEQLGLPTAFAGKNVRVGSLLFQPVLHTHAARLPAAFLPHPMLKKQCNDPARL